MTKRGDSKFFQVLVCQVRQDTKIDVILGKALRVLHELSQNLFLKSSSDPLKHNWSDPTDHNANGNLNI